MTNGPEYATEPPTATAQIDRLNSAVGVQPTAEARLDCVNTRDGAEPTEAK